MPTHASARHVQALRKGIGRVNERSPQTHSQYGAHACGSVCSPPLTMLAFSPAETTTVAAAAPLPERPFARERYVLNTASTILLRHACEATFSVRVQQ